ncbi:MAG: hypothetical protein ACOY3Z_02090 [Thermodesulfobacteriota bacterium]
METSDASPVCGNKMKKALGWMAETLAAHPDKRRAQVLREAEVRFDLSPAECAFLDANFSGRTPPVG